MQDVAFGPGISESVIKGFAEKRRAFDEATEALEQAEKEYRAVEELLYDALLRSGTTSIRIDGLGTCTRTVKGPYTSIDRESDPQAEERLRAWCDENGHSEIFRFAPVMSSLNPIVKEIRKNGEPIPPGVKVTEHKRIQVLKRKD